MSKYIDTDKLISEIDKILAKAEKDEKKSFCEIDANGHLIAVTKTAICVRVKKIITSLQQEQPRKRLIQVKCLYPYDESWQKNKVYTCEVWHHGDLNRDFWDVYYDYGKDARYVQFPSIELLNEEFVAIQEQPEVDLEKEIEEQINIYYNECEKKLNQMSDDDTDIGFLTLNNFARHFYELGLNAKKEE